MSLTICRARQGQNRWGAAKPSSGEQGIDFGSPHESDAPPTGGGRGSQIGSGSSRSGCRSTRPCFSGSLISQGASLPPIRLHTDQLTGSKGLVVGRSNRLSHVQIHDARVTQQHVWLRLVNGAIWLECLSSTKGTRVQGQSTTPLKPLKLGGGAVLQIAGLPYRIRLE